MPQISSNLLVALPGTPVYEYARLKGFLGSTLAGEEKYLLRVSDQGGGSPLQFNFTDTPYFIVQSWASLMLIEVLYHYYNQQKLPRLSLGQLMKGVFQLISKPRGQREFTSSFFSHPFFFHSRYVLVPLYWIFQNFKECDTSLFVERCLELILWPFKKKTFTEYVSLRQFMNNNTPNLHEIKKKKTHPFLLRLGR